MSKAKKKPTIATHVFRLALLVSVVANGAVGVINPGDLHPAVTASVHALYPLFLAAAEALLVRVPTTGHRWADRLCLTFGGGIAIVAFVGSAENLHKLAVMAGLGEFMAWTLPVIIDLTMAVAMVKVVALATPAKAPKVYRVPSTVTDTVRTKAPSTAVDKPAKTVTKPSGKVTPELVAEALQGSPGATMEDLAKGLKCSVRTVGRYKAKAVELGLLEAVAA